MVIPKPTRWKRWIKYLVGLALLLFVALVILILLGPKDSGKPYISKFDNCDYEVNVIVFADNNGNGVQDSSESGVAGVKITLEHSQPSPSDVPEQSNTDSNGSARISDVAYGCYIHDTITVHVVPPTGYTASTPLSFGPYLSDSRALDGMTEAAQHPLPSVIYVGLRRN